MCQTHHIRTHILKYTGKRTEVTTVHTVQQQYGYRGHEEDRIALLSFRQYSISA
jgi:hypothetical protein